MTAYWVLGGLWGASVYLAAKFAKVFEDRLIAMQGQAADAARRQEEILVALTESVDKIATRLQRLDLALGQRFHDPSMSPFGVPWETVARMVRNTHRTLAATENKTKEEIHAQAEFEAWLRRGIPGYVPPADDLPPASSNITLVPAAPATDAPSKPPESAGA
jgi:hypothetical protein